mgnify:FL=1
MTREVLMDSISINLFLFGTGAFFVLLLIGIKIGEYLEKHPKPD